VFDELPDDLLGYVPTAEDLTDDYGDLTPDPASVPDGSPFLAEPTGDPVDGAAVAAEEVLSPPGLGIAGVQETTARTPVPLFYALGDHVTLEASDDELDDDDDLYAASAVPPEADAWDAVPEGPASPALPDLPTEAETLGALLDTDFLVENETGVVAPDVDRDAPATYEVQGRIADGVWSTLATVPGDDLDAELLGLPAGESWAFRVRAVFPNGEAGDWSAETPLDLPMDLLAPPVPSTPVVNGERGVATLYWDGLGVGGAPQPADYKHTVVWRSASGLTGTWTAAGLLFGKGSLIFTDVPYNDDTWFSLSSRDLHGNESTRSAADSVTLTPLVSAPDIADGIITSASGDYQIAFSFAEPTPPAGGWAIGDHWYKYDTPDPLTQKVADWFRWTSTGWVQMQWGEEFLPQVNIGSGTYSDLDGGRIKAGSVEADRMVANTFKGYTFTGTVFQTDDLPNVGMKMYADVEGGGGLVAFDSTGEQYFRISSDLEENTIGIYGQEADTDGVKSGPTEYLAGMASTGALTGQSLAVAGDARIDGLVVINGDPLTTAHNGFESSGDWGPVMNGRSLLGPTFTRYVDQHPNMSDNNSWMTVVPHGVIANGWREQATAWTWSGTGGDLHYRIPLTVTANFLPGRMYQITYRTPAIRETGTLGTGNVGAAHVRRSASGGVVTAGDASPTVRGTRMYLPRGGSHTVASMTTVVRCPEDVPQGKVMLGVEVYVYEDFTAESTTTTDANRWEIGVMDLGVSRLSNDGQLVDLQKQSATTTGTSTPAPDEPERIVKTWNYGSGWWNKTYRGNGTSNSFYDGKPAQGYSPYASGNGRSRALIKFPDTVSSTLSTKTVNKVEAYVYVAHTHYNSGGTINISSWPNNNTTDTDAAPSSYGTASTTNTKSVAMKKPEGRWITLPTSWHAGIKSGTIKAFSLGATSDDPKFYLYTTAAKTRIRVTYTA
jgi:hypothetical protein